MINFKFKQCIIYNARVKTGRLHELPTLLSIQDERTIDCLKHRNHSSKERAAICNYFKEKGKAPKRFGPFVRDPPHLLFLPSSLQVLLMF